MSGIRPFIELLRDIHVTTNTESSISWSYEFTRSNGFDESSTLWAKDLFEVKNVYPALRTDRAGELYDVLKADPLAAVEACIEVGDPHPTEFWSELATFTPNSTVRNHVDEEGYDMQYLNDASSTCINMDYFSIPITTMPKKSNGQRMTDDELINHLRFNINNYSDFPGVYGSNFSPIPSDNAEWFSNSPKGAIVHIEIGPDDGSVVCSDYLSCCWVFSTIEETGWIGDGKHPVSGNRQFGISNIGGNKAFYIKGVDRLKNVLMSAFAGCNYDGGDNLWNGLISNFATWINANAQDGNCTTSTPDLQRPKWEDIKAQLIGTDVIESVTCQ